MADMLAQALRDGGRVEPVAQQDPSLLARALQGYKDYWRGIYNIPRAVGEVAKDAAYEAFIDIPQRAIRAGGVYGDPYASEAEKVQAAGDIFGAAAEWGAAGLAVPRPKNSIGMGGRVKIKNPVPKAFDAFQDGEFAGSLNVADGGPFVSSVVVEPGFRNQGVGRQLYRAAEESIGRDLVPSPLGLTDAAVGFWRNKLSGLSPQKRAAVIEESVAIGRSYGISDADLRARLAPLMEGNDLPMDEASRMARAREMGFDVDTPYYHGTTHNFEEFGGATGNIEGHFGAGHYFTSNPHDASKNYAGLGPDLTQRVELRAERLADEAQYERGVSEDVAARWANWKARKELKGDHEGAVLPVYLRGNTADVRNHTRGQPTILEMDTPDPRKFMDDARRDLGPDADDFEVEDLAMDMAYEDAAYRDPEGTLADFVKSIRNQSDEYGYDADEVLSSIDDALADGVISADDIDRKLRNSALMYAEHPETGELASNEIIRRAFQDAGFENILMDAQSAFPNMKNIPDGTTHVVTSNPANIRSRFAKFDPAKKDSSNILASVLAAGGAGAALAPVLADYELPR